MSAIVVGSQSQKHTQTHVRRAFWVGMIASWASCLTAFVSTTPSSPWGFLFILSPFCGAVALGAAIWLRSPWRIVTALILGIGAVFFPRLLWTILGG